MTEESVWLRFAWDAECDSPMERLALLGLCIVADPGSGVARISYKELARKMSCSPAGAIRAVESLCEKRHIAKHAMVRDDGGRLPNAYVVAPALRHCKTGTH